MDDDQLLRRLAAIREAKRQRPRAVRVLEAVLDVAEITCERGRALGVLSMVTLHWPIWPRLSSC